MGVTAMLEIKPFDITPAILIYVGLAISMLGIFPVLAVVGDGGVEPAGAVFGILFGAIFGLGGGLLQYKGISSLMTARLGSARPFFPGLLQLIWMRADRKSLYAALPNILIASQILFVMIHPEGFPWLERSDFGHLIVLEFFAIHATAFLGLIAFVRWHGLAVIPQIAIFCGLLGIYSFTSYQVAGIEAAIGFALLTLSKYIGYAVKPLTFRSKGKIALRWFTGFLIFILVSAFFDVDLETKDNLAFAATYFIALAIFEAFDLMAPGSGESPEVQAAPTLQEERNG